MSVSTHRKFFQRLFFVSAFPVGYLSYKDTYMVSTLLKRNMIPLIRIALDFWFFLTSQFGCHLGGKYLVFVSSRSVKMRGFSFLSLHAFWGKCVYFQFLNNKMHNCVLFAIIVHFNIQKLKNKHTFIQTEKAKSSHFDRTRGDKKTDISHHNFLSSSVVGSNPSLGGKYFTFSRQYPPLVHSWQLWTVNINTTTKNLGPTIKQKKFKLL